MEYLSIPHYRGLKEKYNAELHSDGIFFTTDTHEIIANSSAYGETIDDWELADGVLTLKKSSGETLKITFDEASESSKGLMSAADKKKMNSITTDVDAHIKNTNNPHSVTKTQVGLGNVTNDAQVKRSEMGVVNGVATLGSDGKIPSSQYDSFSIVSKTNKSEFPSTGSTQSLYIETSTGSMYQWDTASKSYTKVASSLQLGTTSTTAYAGDKGNTAYKYASAVYNKSLTHLDDNNLFTTDSNNVTINYTCYQGDQYSASGVSHAIKIPAATTSSAGVMTAEDKTTLSSISTTYVSNTTYNTYVTANEQNIAGVKNTISSIQNSMSIWETKVNNKTVSLSETSSDNYAKVYTLTQGSSTIGTINIPKDMVVSSGELKTVTTADTPYTGAKVGDKYIDLTIANATSDHVYIPLADIASAMAAGKGIDITSGTVSVKLDSTSDSYLTVGTDGVKLSGVTTALDTKVDKVDGKQLSTNDFTDSLKTKLQNLNVDSLLNTTSTNAIQNATIAKIVSRLFYYHTVDLSYQDIYGTTSEKQNTANCYVVKEEGDYKIPLVYGNAIKNGEPNTAAYTNLALNEHMVDYVNAYGTQITSPYIETDLGKSIVSAEVLVQDANVVTNATISKGYLMFTVMTVPITGANAIISIRDSDGTIVWSWHIWIFPYDLTPVTYVRNNNTVKFLPWCLATTFNEGDQYKAIAWYYQFGHISPTVGPYAYNQTNSDRPQTWGTLYWNTKENYHKGYEEGIKEPNVFWAQGNVYTDNWYGNNPEVYNLWNANSSTNADYDLAVVKTVYDPSPVGFKVPHAGLLSVFDSTYWLSDKTQNHGLWFKKTDDDTDGQYVQFTGLAIGTWGTMYEIDQSSYFCSSTIIGASSMRGCLLRSTSQSMATYTCIIGSCLLPTVDNV